MKNRIIQDDLASIAGAELPWEQLSGKTVLITGANGFLPSYMVKTLIYLNAHKNLDIRIIGLVRNEKKAMERFGDYVKAGRLTLIVQDVCDPIIYNSDVDYIVHAASQASPKYFGADPVGTLSANVLGTYNLLELAREKNVIGFLYFSSGEVYGEVSEDKIPTKEDDYGYVNPTNVRSCYAESKRMGENMCVSWHHQYGVPAKIVRPFHTYGPGMSFSDGRVFADFVADIVNRRDIIMKSDGSAIRSFCYLADAVAGFFTVLLKGQSGQAYNVSNDKCEISIIDLAETLVSLFPEFGIKVIKKEGAYSQEYLKSKISRIKPDIGKIRTLGWQPHYSIKEGFQLTVQSYLCY